MTAVARKTPSYRWRWLVPATLLVLLFNWSPFRTALDWEFFDAASRRPLRTPELPPDSAIVLVDELTMQRMSDSGVRWPFPRDIFAQLLIALHQAGAAQIRVDFTFLEESEAGEKDLLLGAVAAAADSITLARTARAQPVFWNAEFVTANPQFFRHPRTGLVDYRVENDGVARSYEIARSLGAPDANEASGRRDLLRWQGNLDRIRERGVPVLSAAAYIQAGRALLEAVANDAPDLNPADIARALALQPKLTGELADRVRGRTVFVGANASGTFDVKPMPVGKLEPGLLLHWTAWTNHHTGGMIVRVPPWSVVAGALALTGLIVWSGANRQSLRPVVFTAVALGALLLATAYAGLSFGWFLPPATPAVAIAVTLLGVIAETYWIEQQRKREIQSMFGAYVDPTVVAKLVRNPEAIELGGEKREATVFFSDLAGFTDLSEKLPPEQLVKVVNAYLDETSECLMNHGGYVDKYIGDAVMAVFGAPSEHHDHAYAACLAALEALHLLTDINTRYAGDTGVRLAVRIGVNTGEMIVGNLGSRRKKNYTVMGDAVNLASRLEGANKYFGTGILLGTETARRVEGRLAIRPLARLRVKGKLQAVEVYTLHGRSETLPDREREYLAAYRSGYDAYISRDFASAFAAFNRAESLMPGDQTTLYLRQQSEQFLHSPPPPEWDATVSLDSK